MRRKAMRRYWDICKKKVRYIWLWLWRKDVVIFLLFIGLSSIFWLGRAMSSPRDMKLAVGVNYIGIPRNVLLSESLPMELEVTIRDEGKQLRQISNQVQELTLDLSSLFGNEEGEVRLTSDVFRSRLQDLLPGSTRIQHIRPDEIVVGYLLDSIKRVPVCLSGRIEASAQYQLVGSAVLTPSEVELYGSSSLLEAIDSIRTESIQLLDVHGDVSETLRLLPPSGVRVYPSSVELSWRSEQFTEKTFRLPIHMDGTPLGESVRLFPHAADVTLRVIVSEFAAIESDDLYLYCRYPDEECSLLPLELKTSHPHIYSIRIEPDAVEYIIER